MELETEQKIGTARPERRPNRLTQRNGNHEGGLVIRVGELELRLRKLRTASCFSSLLDPRRRAKEHW